MPNEIQLSIHTRIWLKVTEALKNITTTGTLLNIHEESTRDFNMNVSIQF